MSIMLIAVTSFMIALSGALVPGPLFTITVSETMKRGFRAGPLIIIGHGLLELLIVLLIVFGVTPLLTADRTKTVITMAGGVVLIIMGLMLIKDAGKLNLDLSLRKPASGIHPVFAGIIGSLSNPYWFIWWITIGLGYLISSLAFGAGGVVAFFLGHISADLLWYSIISFAVSKGRRMMGDRGYRSLLYACGIFLIFFGCWFLSGV